MQKTSKKICFVGHRIQDMGGFSNPPKLHDHIKEKIKEILKQDSNVILLTSLSIGIELWAGQIAYELNIPIYLYIPFINYYSKWPFFIRKQYLEIEKNTNKKIYISKSDQYDIAHLINKDIKLIEDSDIVYSFYKETTPLLKKYLNKKKIYNVLPSGDKDDFFITI